MKNNDMKGTSYTEDTKLICRVPLALLSLRLNIFYLHTCVSLRYGSLNIHHTLLTMLIVNRYNKLKNYFLEE